MKRIALYLVCLLTSMLAYANYSITMIEGDVKVCRSHSEFPATKGLKLNSNDELIIAPGAKVEIYNALTKEIYTSTSAGRTTVMDLRMNARQQAGRSNVLGGIQTKPRSATNARHYTEGSVKRSLAVYDPEGAALDTDPELLALSIYDVLSGTTQPEPIPVQLTTDSIGENGFEFRLTNTLDFPIYFNVFQMSPSQAGMIMLSELGQPTGCYVLLPGHMLTRGVYADMGNSHPLLVMTHYQFDADDVLSAYTRAYKGELQPKDGDSTQCFTQMLK